MSDEANWEDFDQQREVAGYYAQLKKNVFDNMVAAGFSEDHALKVVAMVLSGKV